MTDTTPTSTLFMGIYIPVADFKPTVIPEPMFSIAKGKRGDEKALSKYLASVAVALDLDTEGMTRDGKPIGAADLAAAIFAWQVEAEEAAERRRKEAEAARKAHEAKVQRLATLEARIKDETKANPGGVTYADLMTWAAQAAKDDAFIVIHGGTGEGAGIFLRHKGAAPARAGRPTGGGKRGGTETRTSAYAEAIRGMRKGDPFRIRRETMADGRRAYFDDARGGLRLEIPLSRYLLAEYPDSHAARALRGYEERRKAALAAQDNGED